MYAEVHIDSLQQAAPFKHDMLYSARVLAARLVLCPAHKQYCRRAVVRARARYTNSTLCLRVQVRARIGSSYSYCYCQHCVSHSYR